MKMLALVGLHPWLTCRDCVESVTDYLEGALSSEAHADVLAHLDHCPHCLRYFRQVELTVRIARRITPGSPVDARAALLDAFRTQHGETAEH